jgi:Protein of unknown function (DUF2959)
MARGTQAVLKRKPSAQQPAAARGYAPPIQPSGWRDENGRIPHGLVLAAFKDQVLFLKHNLNARAISSLQQNADQIQSDVARLVREMEASIKEANEFIELMQAAK